MEKHTADEENEYIVVFHRNCAKKAGEAEHTITYRKATCTRVDDIVLNFHCSIDSQCDDCRNEYT